MIIDVNTAQLMDEWTEHMTKHNMKPVCLFACDSMGRIHAIAVSEFTTAHMADTFERMLSDIKKKQS